MARGEALAALVLVTGCAPPPVVRPTPPPSAAELLSHLRARAARVGPLRDEAKVDYFGGRTDRVKLTITLLTAFGREGGLRIDAENPMGGNMASLASQGGRFQFLDVRQNRFFDGPAEPCGVARLLGVELAPSAAVAILQGGAPLEGMVSSGGWDPTEGGRELLTLRDERGQTETLWLTGVGWDVVQAEVRAPGGELLYRLRHEDFRLTGAVRLPWKTQIFDLRHKADAKIRFRSREVGVAVPAGAFRLEAPAGLPIEPVTCSR